MRESHRFCVIALFLLASCRERPQTVSPDGTATAGGTAAAAGVMWAVVGCRLQGCPYGSYCDKQEGYCKVVSCTDGCPKGTVCNEGLDRCQDMPPAKAPTDRLPQDDKINRLPGN